MASIRITNENRVEWYSEDDSVWPIIVANNVDITEDNMCDYIYIDGKLKYNPIIMTPQTISKLQAVSQLLNLGRYEELMTILDSDPTGVKRILFDAAHQLDRDSSMVNEIALALEFTSEDTDTFFIEAYKILV